MKRDIIIIEDKTVSYTHLGANVLVKGTTNGQITDLNGGFSIKVEHASATLLEMCIRDRGYTMGLSVLRW